MTREQAFQKRYDAERVAAAINTRALELRLHKQVPTAEAARRAAMEVSARVKAGLDPNPPPEPDRKHSLAELMAARGFGEPAKDAPSEGSS
jgi:hypothetical protein